MGTQLKIAGTVDEQHAILMEKLQERIALKSDDHFQFRVESTAKPIESAPYGGFRFQVRSMIAGKLFVAFPLDIGFGDVIIQPIEEIEGVDWLDFCEIPPAKFDAISLEQQFAEKIHAMTVDRGERENSRVKDLVDILLLMKTHLDKERVSLALERTFRRRGELPVPTQLPKLPHSWRQPFKQMAIDCGLNIDFDTAITSLSAYWAVLNM